MCLQPANHSGPCLIEFHRSAIVNDTPSNKASGKLLWRLVTDVCQR